jgi:3-hydroxyisobutyrate dehydrogenase-like beta-hydroxyacid dehydrogenase
MTERVGIIGLGIMGGAIARNLCRKDVAVVGFDIDPAACAKARDSGVAIATDAGDVAAGARVILLSLPSPAAARRVVAEVAAAAAPGCILVELSTLALDDKVALREIAAAAGHVLLDCPLSGTGAQAATGDLAVYASGDPAAIARCRPIFAHFARVTFDVGAFGNGSKMKFVANHLVAIHNVATAEAMTLGLKAGLDLAQLIEVVAAGAGTSKVFELRAPLMATQSYEPATMQLSIWQKDMRIIGAFAAALSAPTPVFDATQSLYAAAIAQGRGAQDTAAVCAVLEQMAGHARATDAS